jgi:hypothetical protein
MPGRCARKNAVKFLLRWIVMVKTAKVIITSLAFLILGAGFCALIWVEFKLGFAAGSFGGVRLSEHPVVFLFFVVFQANFVRMSIFAIYKSISDIKPESKNSSVNKNSNILKFRLIYIYVKIAVSGLVSLLGLLTAIDVAVTIFIDASNFKDVVDRFVFPGLMLIIIGVLLYSIYMFFIQPIYQDLIPESQKLKTSMDKKNREQGGAS